MPETTNPFESCKRSLLALSAHMLFAALTQPTDLRPRLRMVLGTISRIRIRHT